MTCCSSSAPDRQYLSSSRGVCRECGEIVEVRYVSEGGKVYLERFCKDHGTSKALVAESLEWYLKALSTPGISCAPGQILTKHYSGCPTSCGPCGFHAQRCNLPVFSITNACDLRCPICFTYNREDRRYFMSAEEFDRHLRFVVDSTGGVDLVNITGGEPTLHPELLTLLRSAKRPGIGRITLNSNGLTLARNPELAKALADLGVYVILSLDTLDPERSIRIHGADITKEKQQALDNLEKYGVNTTLLMVLIGGVNEDELGSVVDIMLQRDFIRSLTIQTMTYTGQGGGLFQPRIHLPVDGVARRIEEATVGRIRREFFTSMPSAHPLCYAISYLLPGKKIHSLSELLSPERMAAHLANGYLLRPTADFESELRSAIDLLWASGESPTLLAQVKTMIQDLYPPGKPIDVEERRRRAERQIKTIYIHAHMDQDTFEIGRAMRCPDQVPVNAEKLIGACAYNLFYRMKDDRFWKQSDK